MGHLELVERLLSSVAKVDGHKLRTGRNLRSDEFTRLADAREVIDRIFIDETPERTMRQIVANGRRFKRRENIGLIVVDYIQLIDGEQSRDSRQEQIALVSRRLKVLARAVQVPVLALSQLNRRVEDREDRKPRLSDLRESGAIEQDADVVLLLNRPEVYDPNDEPGIAEVHVAKNRNGPVGTVKLAFLKNITRFENLAVATF
jgi:replicative DNA helicase